MLKEKLICLFLLSILFIHTGCRVQYVADYDENIKNEIISISSEVERFFVILSEIPKEERIYESFKDDYLTIEIKLQTLLTRNKIRPLNEESTRQTELALELWLDDKEKHKTNNTVSDFIIKQHREQFRRIFIAMAIGEEAKAEE